MIAGIDFGTTNSVLCVIGDDGVARSARFAAGQEVFRSLLNFWVDDQGGRRSLKSAGGFQAIETYLDDPPACRLILSMKTYLSQRSFTQTRIFGQDFKLEDLVARFLHSMMTAADLNLSDPTVIVGRPVRFAGETADDTLGETRLRASFARAGFADIDVALEPEAAGYRFVRTLDRPSTVLVGDFGGGTSDFSLLRFQPGGRGGITYIGHAGVGVAGDTFDRRIMDHVVCPLLGKGGSYAVMGNDMPIPIGLYTGLSQWHRLSLMRTPRVLSEIADIARTAREPARLAALEALLRDEAGYELYRAVSATKAALSSADVTNLTFRHGGLSIAQEIRRADFEQWIAEDLQAMATAVDHLLTSSGIGAEGVDDVFLTGGTSLVPAVRRIFSDRFGVTRLRGGGEFISVAEGLALIGQDRDKHRRPPAPAN